MTNDQIYAGLAKKYGMEFNDIRKICNSGFKFIHERITAEDPKSILMAGLFRIKMKSKYKNRLNLCNI